MKDITRKDSAVLKGIAILILLCHHNFRKAGLFRGYEVSFWPFTQNQIVSLSFFFKITVSIFIFISGYGLTVSYRSKNENYSIKKDIYTPWVIQRLFKLLSGYWFIFIMMSILCQMINGRTWDIYFKEGFLYGIYQYVISFFGLARLFDMSNLVYTWWYMSAAVIIVFLVPILNSIAKNRLGYFLTFCMLWIVPHFMGLEYQGDTHPFTYILILFLGCACGEYKLFAKVKSLRWEKHPKLWGVLKGAMAIVLLFLCYKEYAVFLKAGKWEMALNIIPFVVIYLCYEYICPIPYLNTVLEYIGSHSLNIFLIHTFIRGVYLADFTYSWGHFMLINLVLLGLSLIASILVEKMKKLLNYDVFINKISNGCIRLICKGE